MNNAIAAARPTRRPMPLPFQTPGEEIANSVIHGVGALFGIAGTVLLALRGNGLLGGQAVGPAAVAAYSVYGASLVLLFLASTLYHAVAHEGAKQVLRVLDHGAIYLLIAGTYTPFCLVALRGPWGWGLFAAEWILAAAGITLYALGFEALKKVEVGVYVLMGWAIVLGGKNLAAALPPAALAWLAVGGVAYTAGTVWYGMKARRGTHVAWHGFVLAGAAAHFVAVWLIG